MANGHGSPETNKQTILDANRAARWRRESLEGYIFIAPAAILIGTFGILPVFYNLYLSLHRWRIRRGPFIGLQNYTDALGSFMWAVLLVAGVIGAYVALRGLFASGRHSPSYRASGFLPVVGKSARLGIAVICVVVGIVALAFIRDLGDDAMVDSLRVTIWYSLGTVPVQLGLGLFVAILLDQKFRGKQFFRVVYLLPYIVPTVASASIFQVLFSLRPQSFMNELIALFGADPLGWLGERAGVFRLALGLGAVPSDSIVLEYLRTWVQGPSLALVSIMFFNHWVYIGYYALIYSNGLAAISRELYEAAEVDGASKRTVLFDIIVPLLSPTTFFLTLLGIIGTFKAFNSVYVLRNPATGGAADTLSIYIFFTFFRRSRFGYAAALAFLLFLVVIGLTAVQKRYMERRVNYGE